MNGSPDFGHPQPSGSLAFSVPSSSSRVRSSWLNWPLAAILLVGTVIAIADGLTRPLVLEEDWESSEAMTYEPYQAAFVFGIAMSNYVTLTNAVSTGARTVALNAQLTTDPCLVASSAIEAAAPSLNPNKMTFSYTFNGVPQSGASCNSASIDSGAALDLASGTTVTVTATYPLNLSIFGTQMSPSNAVLQATSTELVQ